MQDFKPEVENFGEFMKAAAEFLNSSAVEKLKSLKEHELQRLLNDYESLNQEMQALVLSEDEEERSRHRQNIYHLVNTFEAYESITKVEAYNLIVSIVGAGVALGLKMFLDSVVMTLEDVGK